MDQAAAVDPAGELSACRQRLALLTRLAEGDSENRQRYRVMLAEQMDRWPWLSDLTAVEARVMGGSRWSLFREFESSAGIHPVQQPVFASENPGLRVRRALFAHPEPFDHLLSGRGELRLRLRSARNTVTQLTLNRPQLSYLRATPVHVSWQADDQPPQHIRLDRPHEPQRLNVSLPPGDHLIRLRLDQPIAGQYVQVQIHELQASEARHRWTEQPDARPKERLYQVATRAQPLRFRVFGPTRIRIDERAGDATRTRYFHVLTREQQFELSPPTDSESALFRVFEWVEDPQQSPLEVARFPTPPPQRLPVWLDQLPPACLSDFSAVDPVCFTAPAIAWGDPVGLLSLAAPTDPPQAIELPDAFPLGGQEKGSWAVGSGAFSRRPVDEDFQSGAPDEFVELRIGYDQFDADSDTSTRTDTLLRLREASGPTWGLGHQRWWSWPAEGNATSQPQYGRPLPPNDLFLFWDLYGFLTGAERSVAGQPKRSGRLRGHSTSALSQVVVDGANLALSGSHHFWALAESG